MISELKKELEKCDGTDNKFETIYRFVLNCTPSSAREKFISENFIILRKRIIKEDYLQYNYYFRLVYNYLIRPIKPLGKLVHPDWEQDYFEGKAFFYEYSRKYKGFVDDIIDNIEKYKKIYNLLADEKSKQVLVGVLTGRLIGSKAEFEKVMDPTKSQYLDENVIGHKEKEVFADIGGYDGQSTLDFFKYSQDKDVRSYVFELDHINAEKMRELFKDDNRVSVIEKGCADKPGKVFYELGGTSIAKSVEHETDSCGILTTLDDEVDDKFTYIKMDVEGAEEGVLLGAKKHIENDRPRLAICVYHKPGDIWKLHKIVDDIGIPYKYYLRQYDNYEAETVLYAV